MKCEYSDGLKVDYSGPIQITKGNEVKIFVQEDRIPDLIKDDLDMALYRSSCVAMREAADEVTKTFGKKACVH